MTKPFQGIDANERAFANVRNMLVSIILDGVANVSPEGPQGWRRISPEKADQYIERGRKLLADFEGQTRAPRGRAQRWMEHHTTELRRLLSDAEAVRSGGPQKMMPDSPDVRETAPPTITIEQLRRLIRKTPYVYPVGPAAHMIAVEAVSMARALGLDTREAQMWLSRHAYDDAINAIRQVAHADSEFREAHHVADFSTLDDLIEHARQEGATHTQITGTGSQQDAFVYFPHAQYRGYYEQAQAYREHGYWHVPAQSDRHVVSRLPRSARPIELFAGGRAAEARKPSRRSPGSAMQIAADLSRRVGGSKPESGRSISGAEQGTVFTTYSPAHQQPVVVLVNALDTGAIALSIYSSESLSESDRYESISSFLYGPGGYTSQRVDLNAMVETIEWVWETVDGYAESWQQDGGDVDETPRRSAHHPPNRRRARSPR